jgi:hypothetical protein
VIVEAKELRFWESFSHQHGGRTLAAPNIGDARAGLELGGASLVKLGFGGVADHEQGNVILLAIFCALAYPA